MTAKIELSNPREPLLAPIDVAALADTGSVFLCIPEHVRIQLKLEALEHREVKLADGSRATYPYVGPDRFALQEPHGIRGRARARRRGAVGRHFDGGNGPRRESSRSIRRCESRESEHRDGNLQARGLNRRCL